jgi:hypothetical protein
MSSRTQFGFYCCKIPLHYIIKYNNCNINISSYFYLHTTIWLTKTWKQILWRHKFPAPTQRWQNDWSYIICRSQQINWTAWKIAWNVAELSRPFLLLSGLHLHRKCKELWELSTGQNCIQWISSQPLSLLLNNRFYPLASYPLDKCFIALSSG